MTKFKVFAGKRLIGHFPHDRPIGARYFIVPVMPGIKYSIERVEFEIIYIPMDSEVNEIRCEIGLKMKRVTKNNIARLKNTAFIPSIG